MRRCDVGPSRFVPFRIPNHVATSVTSAMETMETLEDNSFPSMGGVLPL